MKTSLTNEGSSTPLIPAPQTQHTNTQLLNSVILGNLSGIHLLLAPTSVPLFLLLALLCIPLFCHPPSLYFLKNHDHIIYFPCLSLKFKANQKALVRLLMEQMWSQGLYHHMKDDSCMPRARLHFKDRTHSCHVPSFPHKLQTMSYWTEQKLGFLCGY